MITKIVSPVNDVDNWCIKAYALFVIFFGNKEDRVSHTTPEGFKTFYHAFRDVSRAVHSKADMKEIFDLVVLSAAKGLNAKGTALCVINRKLSSFKRQSSYGVSEEHLGLGLMSKNSLLPESNKVSRVHIITDMFDSPRVQNPQKLWDDDVRMLIDAPFVISDHILGFIRVYFDVCREISDDEADFVQAVAEQCACAINHDDTIKSHIMQYNKLVTKVDKMSSLGRMAAGIAHEINNPLTGILLYSSNLFKKVKEPGPLKDGLEIIMNETQRCKVTIQGLLDFSREKRLEKVSANINKIINKALALMDNEFHLKRINVVRDLDCDIQNFLFDDNQIEQVLINFLLNAAHANDENGTIYVRSRMEMDKKCVVVEFEDNGCGIPKDKLKRIFEPFYTTKSEGTGLGLAVSYGIIKNHRGTIKISSELGIGTLISIALPIIEQEAENN